MSDTTNQLTRAGKNAELTRLPLRLNELAAWVALELDLPEEDQIPLKRLSVIVSTFIGEHVKRAAVRAGKR